ncbi:hypothetical protein P167DRAFT_495410 [Morchella conica CCBAS932]|uniref:C2H2 type master regulator of conidiophore development brlA n=1 Tax=Morchella conica CCBAS932 TaxID=1392247 RepID=A0A3N4KB03_9PEZI|nr:hypothetical protein P167DRAFT_495410 [Morchella conica CCBAS932]
MQSDNYHTHHQHHHHRSNSPLSPPASEGLMSPMNHQYQQDPQDKLPMDPSLPGIWMSNDTNMLQGHAGAASPPPLFLEDILRAEDPHNMPVMGSGFMDDHEFQDHGLGIRAMKRARSADISSVVDMHSHYEGSPAPSGAPRDRKKRRLTDPSEANFHCNKCGKYFSRIWNYNAHLETHDPDRPRPHVCRVEECKKAFVRRTDLTRHQACVHAKEKKFRCELCNNMFARKDTLRRHEDDGCPKRVDIASRANKNKPIVWNSQALSFYTSMQQQQREDAFSNMGYDSQLRTAHYDNGMSSHLPPLSDIVPIQKAATTMW